MPDALRWAPSREGDVVDGATLAEHAAMPTSSSAAARIFPSKRRSIVCWLLGAAGLGGIILTGVQLHAMSEARCALVTDESPDAMVSLQLAPNAAAAARIIQRWRTERPSSRCPGVEPGQSALDVASVQLAQDENLLVAYASTLALLGLASVGAVLRPVWPAVVVALAALGAGVCDHLENGWSARLLAAEMPCHAAYELGWQRVLAQSKFVLLLGVGIAIVTALLAWLRRAGTEPAEEGPSRGSFAELMRVETEAIVRRSGRTGGPMPSTTAGPAGEPWVDRRQHDLVGVALSGGGIRSATFSLGFLAGLNKLRMLPRIDYLATVSGGGYLGSFWTAWLAHRQKIGGVKRATPLWPWNKPVEAGPVRHLREFSRFLAARRGFFEAETWEAIVAVLAGVLLSALTAASLIGLGLIAWLATNFFLACPDQWAGTMVVFALTVATAVAYHRGWSSPSQIDPDDARRGLRIKLGATAIATTIAVLVEGFWFHRSPRVVYTWLHADAAETALPVRSYAAWWELTGIERLLEPGIERTWFWSPSLYHLSEIWISTALLMLVLRIPWVVYARRGDRGRIWLPSYDRVLMQLLGSALGWAAITTLWHVSINFRPLTGKLTLVSIVSGGAFAALRNWIGVSLRSGKQASAFDRFKPYLPEILAYLTVALVVVGVGGVMVTTNGHDWLAWYRMAALMCVPIVVMLVLDPSEIGLHSFYRDRIVRAYSGASNPHSEGSAEKNRHTSRRDEDDVRLVDLSTRPLHLVCCAANDLSGDPIATLGRGARSATLSRNGIVMGGVFVSPPRELTLGAAVTASAAAFNSNMGSVSMSVGPMVSFLMAALNLRLGLWVSNPRYRGLRRQRLLPGTLFFREMFALTIADEQGPEIHLSDGGHFDNLGLYELIRRHCRYVIVCDCGADPDVSFDDFGNAARRIREDFGVDIDVDLRPLEPDAERRSRQHAVVGKIHYGEFDKGILVYVKPTLTGDEPPDVLQHAARNRRFPHEPTTDQFYDEAQWESYRKLGEHTACEVFGFVDRHPEGTTPTSDWIFMTARQDWFPTPPDLPQRALEMTAHFSLAKNELQREGVESLLREVFPEVGMLPAPRARRRAPRVTEDREQVAILACLVNVVQLMEDVWASCQLDTHWSHPLNLPWVNYFARWASAPTFRLWWPLLRPMYSGQFQRFMEEHFVVLRGQPSDGEIDGPHDEVPPGLAAAWWGERHQPAPQMNRLGNGRKVACGYTTNLYDGSSKTPFQLGIVLISLDPGRAWWTSDDFSVPASLWGAGIGGAFLRALIDCVALGDQFSDQLRKRNFVGPIERIDVYVKAPEGRNDPGSWSDRVSYVEFYKQQGFRLVDEVSSLPDGEVCRAAHLWLDAESLRRRRAALT